MKLHLIYIGNKFIYNKSLKEYILRKVEQKFDFIDSITYFKESDNALFLYLEKELNSSKKIIIITTKQNFSTIGKLICTATSDNQILKENMLIPQKCGIFEDGSYLLEYQNSQTNVIRIDEMQKMPDILLQNKNTNAKIHIFDEDKESAMLLLQPIAQTYDVTIDIIQIIDGWLIIDITSKKFGDISKFIHSSKKLLSKKIIASTNLISYIIDTLSKNNKKISFAESCTGGLLSYYFTKENGASKILDGSLITYSNNLKENWLAVKGKLIEEYGVVSEIVVEQMSEGALDVSHANFAISISGIAGDGGATKSKPVGTVYIGIRNESKHKEVRLNLNGDRNYVQYQSVLYAIKMLLLMDKEMFFSINL
ncbi:MAG: CinA family protein [Campylobacterota bacterium]|nr:CinA family protein [Campylobacterota bacterium]